MNRSITKQFLLLPVLFLGSLLMSSLALSAEQCLDCHGQKGMPGYVDRTLFEQSVHSPLSCTQCHQGVSSYPHNKNIAKVNCGSCHFTGKNGAPQTQGQQYELSVHGKAAAAGNPSVPVCQTCHGSHYIFPSADARSMTNRKKIPTLCSSCHPSEFAEYEKSIHAAVLANTDEKTPTCFDCHMEHLTPPTGSSRWQLSLIRQCGTCHPEQMSTYHKTYHGKVTELGYATMAKCSDCHGSHAIVAVSDPASPLSSQNILTTCRKCHPAATAGFTKFYAHPEEGDRAKYPILYYTFVFMTALLISVFAFFLTHTFLWAYRSLKERLQKKGGE
jgi:hypothetical protein